MWNLTGVPPFWRAAAWACVAVAGLLQSSTELSAQAVDVPLVAQLSRAGVSEPVVASCRGEVRVGYPGEPVAALGSDASGRYALIQGDGVVVTLDTYEGAPDLHCYTIREADRLTAEIARSDTINGRITAEWDGLVVCGTITATTTVCWQHAIERKGFVRIGGWTR